MRLFSSLCLLFLSLLEVALAKSAVGNRLLVVLEDEAQKGLYSKFWADLECMSATATLRTSSLLILILRSKRFQSILPVAERRESGIVPTWTTSLRACPPYSSEVKR